MSTAQHDFDFLPGNWRILNQRLSPYLSENQQWEEFEASQTVSVLPGGIGNFDDFVAPEWRPGFVGMSLRIYNPQTDLWSIYWLDNRSGGLNEQGQLSAPVVGRFTGSSGLFEGDDVINDIAVRVQYRWQVIDADHASWEQAMSRDDGKSWEVNWRMAMQRV